MARNPLAPAESPVASDIAGRIDHADALIRQLGDRGMLSRLTGPVFDLLVSLPAGTGPKDISNGGAHHQPARNLITRLCHGSHTPRPSPSGSSPGTLPVCDLSGCRSLASALVWSCRIRSRVTLKWTRPPRGAHPPVCETEPHDQDLSLPLVQTFESHGELVLQGGEGGDVGGAI